LLPRQTAMSISW